METNLTLRLDGSQFYHDTVPKRQIYLHHTVGGSAKSTFDYWNQSPERIGTAFIVERDGTVYEIFSPQYWAHHLGLKQPYNRRVNMESIGIELASEGALRSGKALNAQLLHAGQKPRLEDAWLYAFDIEMQQDDPSTWFKHAKKLYDMNSSQAFYNTPMFRGYQFFDGYDEPQIAATIELVIQLCERFEIPKLLIPGDRFRYDALLASEFNGVLTHCNVRPDKSDLCPAWNWDRLEAAFNA